MEQKSIRMEHKSVVALLLVITRMIKADSRIDMDEISQLTRLEERYGINHTMMADANRLTLAEAITQLSDLEPEIRQDILQSLAELACTDNVMERHEALLLLTLRYCLLGGDDRMRCEVTSSHIAHRGGDRGTYILYFENERHEPMHKQLDEEWETLQAMTERQGLQFFYVEQIVRDLCKQEPVMVNKMLRYLAPAMNEGQIKAMYKRMTQMSTSAFAQQLLIRNMELRELCHAKPSLLINLDSTDYLRIELTGKPSEHVSRLMEDYSKLASPCAASQAMGEATEGRFSYYSYFRDFFNMMVQAEPRESRIVIWPNKSEFTFPDAGRSLKLNQQEASLYTLILYYTYKEEGKGLPLFYTAGQREIEALYRSLYCRKKCVETAEVIYPDNLAPIRAKIERKMRTQLEGLDNIEDFIPHNENREGYYRISAPLRMVMVKPDSRLDEVSVREYKW